MLDFIGDAYRADHILCDKAFFEWQFRTREHDNSAPIVCAWDGGELIGIIGHLPLVVHWGDLGKVIRAAGLTHWMTKEKAPLGLGWLMMRKVFDLYDLSITVNTSRQGARFFASAGWPICDQLPRCLWIFDKALCANIAGENGSWQDGDAYLYSSISMPSIYRDGLDGYAPDWGLYAQMKFGVIRSAEYLQWRYCEHPIFDYEFAILGENHRPAICVYRIERAYGHCEALVCRIVEFYHPSDEVGRKEGADLIQAVLKTMTDAGCAYVDFYCSSKEYRKTALGIGGGLEPIGDCVLPSRLSPILRETYKMNLTYSTTGTLQIPIFDEVYATKSEIDGDQPARIVC